MIDKLDLRVPEFTAPGPLLERPVMELKRSGHHPLFRPSKYYQYVCDLREPFDLDAVVHLNYRYGRENHKIEIINAGKKTLDEMGRIVRELFLVDPDSLQVMRIDVAADVPGISVSWFKDHGYVSRKRFSSRIEKSHEFELQFVAMSNATSQTLYAGKRPNLMRIYDKLGEWRVQWSKLVRHCARHNAGMTGMDLTEEQRYFGQLVAPTFAEYCMAQNYDIRAANILTRVERQIGGRVPLEFATMGVLRHAHELSPFTGLHLRPDTAPDWYLNPAKGVSIRDHYAAIGLDVVQQALGSYQNAKQFTYQHAKGNGKRILDSLTERRPNSRTSLSQEQLHDLYRESTRPQTLPCSSRGVYLTPTYDKAIQTA